MNAVLVNYETMPDSTAEVANTVGEEFRGKGMQVEVLPLEKVADNTAYNALILNAPMIMGWHRSTLKTALTVRLL